MVINIPELLVAFNFSEVMRFFHMHFNLVRTRLWSDFQKAPHFELRRLLEEASYSKIIC